MGIMHNGTQTGIESNWQNIERSVQRLEMILRLNDFTIWWFPPNTASHFKIDYWWWNEHLAQIIKFVVLCEETSNVSKHRSCFADRFICSNSSNQLLIVGAVDFISSKFLQFFLIERWVHQQSIPKHRC